MNWYVMIPLLVLATVILLAVINPTAGSRLWAALMARIGLLGRWAYNSDPVAILQQSTDNAARNVEEAWSALEEKQALIEQMERIVKSADTEINQLKALANREVANGNEAQARSYLTQVARMTRETTDNRASLALHHQDYEDYKNVIQQNQRRIQEYRDEAKQLRVTLHVSEAEARMAKALPKLDGLDASGMDAARDAVHQRLDSARAASKVARDRMNHTNSMDDLKYGGDDAEADRMLADLKRSKDQ